MEDILASIRRILSDDEQAASGSAAPSAQIAPQPHGDSSDVLPLSESMLVLPPERLPRAAPEPPSQAAAAPMVILPAPEPSRTERPAQEPLVAPEAEAAAAGSVNELVRMLVQGRDAVHVYRGGPTIEDLVREEIRALLKTWLDVHLPPLVERLVRAEIERVVGRVLP
jgi:cell pole-organizing protein PopZ